MQRGRNYKLEVTVTLTADGFNAETFGFVITSLFAIQIVSACAVCGFLRPFERRDPLKSVPGLHARAVCTAVSPEE